MNQITDLTISSSQKMVSLSQLFDILENTFISFLTKC